jgi:hypothetical protein
MQNVAAFLDQVLAAVLSHDTSLALCRYQLRRQRTARWAAEAQLRSQTAAVRVLQAEQTRWRTTEQHVYRVTESIVTQQVSTWSARLQVKSEAHRGDEQALREARVAVTDLQRQLKDISAANRALQADAQSAIRRAEVLQTERDYAVASHAALTVTAAEWEERDAALLSFVDEELKAVWHMDPAVQSMSLSSVRGDATPNAASSSSLSPSLSSSSSVSSSSSARGAVQRLSHALARARLVQEQLTQQVHQLTTRLQLTQEHALSVAARCERAENEVISAGRERDTLRDHVEALQAATAHVPNASPLSSQASSSSSVHSPTAEEIEHLTLSHTTAISQYTARIDALVDEVTSLRQQLTVDIPADHAQACRRLQEDLRTALENELDQTHRHYTERYQSMHQVRPLFCFCFC